MSCGFLGRGCFWPELKTSLSNQFADLHKYGYHIHSVFIHRGSVSFGHYWLYIYDFRRRAKEEDWKTEQEKKQEMLGGHQYLHLFAELCPASNVELCDPPEPEYQNG
jgi:hypothetical protein